MFVIKIDGDDYYIKDTTNGHNEVTKELSEARKFEQFEEALYYRWLNLENTSIEVSVELVEDVK